MSVAGKTAVKVEEIPLGDRRITVFADVPWRLYRGDPHWTPPLRADLLGSRILGLDGLLTPAHPYHRDAEVTHFVAWRGNEAVGRVSAAVNRRYNEYHGERIGFFGFFETIDDDEVTSALLDKAREWVSARGMTVFRGPGEYSTATHERMGVLIEGFQYPPVVELTHNPPYYGPLLERYGLGKAIDYYAYHLDATKPVPMRVVALADRVRQRQDVTVRQVVLSRLHEEVAQIIEIYNDAWSHNWGFLPITDEEAAALADTLKTIIDPGLIRFACVDGEPAAVLGAFPDPNCALRPRWRWYGDSDPIRLARLMLTRRHLPRTRLMFFGIRQPFRNQGLDALLYDDVLSYGREKGYKECDISLLLETNPLILKAAESMGAHRYKAWRIYEMPIS
jgi:GNAT superfamily N-acetyltransferase